MGLQKGQIQKCLKWIFQKLYKILVFDFFLKNQPIGVKSVEEYNFNLFYHNIHEYFAKKII